MKKQEVHEEKWFKFRRIFCKEGFVDIWSGPDTDNPNLESASEDDSLIMNTFFRLNGEGQWMPRNKFDDMMYWLSSEGFTKNSNEIWESALKS
jgi:hypothetical protein